MWWFLACGAPDPVASSPTLEALAGRGVFPIGYRTSTLDYPDPAQVGATRSLRLAVWYPAADAAGDPVTYNGLFPAEDDVWAEPAPASGPFPVAVFSHGHQGYAENSSFLMTHLASHGWLVVAPDHTGNTTFDGPDRETDIYLQRPRDLSAVLDGWASVFPEIAGQALQPAALAIGHSFGGYTIHAVGGATYQAEQACLDDPGGSFCATMSDAYLSSFEAGFLDPRFVALVSMAPGDADKFGTSGLAAIPVPVLHLTGSLDSPETAAEVWEGLRDSADPIGVSIEGAGHQSFTDFADVLEDVPLERDDGFDILRVWVLAFARFHVRGDDLVVGVLEGTTEVSPFADRVE